MDYDPNKPLFDASDAAWLASRNELSAVGPNQLRITRSRFQNRSSDEDSPISPSSASTSDIDSPTLAEDELLILPRKVYSPETFKVLGFDQKTADTLFQKWDTMDPEVRHNFGNFFGLSQEWLESMDIDTFALDNDEWDRCMRTLGINEQLRQAILKPGYEQVRQTQSALEWIKHSMQVRWEALQEGYQVSRERGKELRLRGGGHAPKPFTYDKGYGTMFKPKGNEPGHLTLWKAISEVRMKTAFRNPHQPQVFDITELESTVPSDFDGKRPKNYFTPDLEGAQYYVRYLKGCYAITGSCLVRVQVPNALIEEATPLRLFYPSEVFKKTVWYCRNSYRASLYVPELAQQQLLIGHTTRGIKTKFTDMTSWEEITEKNLVILSDGRPMIQYVFGEEFGCKINAHCQGKWRVVEPRNPDQDLDLWKKKK